jgi:YaiO family outer membrane protein
MKDSCVQCFVTRLLKASLTISLMCALAAVSAAQTVSEQTTDGELRAQAEKLRRQSRWPEALAAYQELVRRHPESFEDRFWIARITGWSGDLKASQQMLVELLRENPRDYDTRVALADTSSWLGKYEAAMAELEQLDRDFPNSAEILLRLGRLHHWQGRNKTARSYFDQVLILDPNQTEAKEGLRRIATELRWELRVEYAGEQNSFAPAAHIGTFAISRIGEGRRTTWTAEGTVSHRFGQTDLRFGVELHHRLRRGATLRWAAFVAPQAEVIARQAYAAAFVKSLGSRLALDAGYAFLAFRSAQAHQVTPQLDFYLNPTLWLTGRYTYSLTNYKGPLTPARSHSGGLSFNWQWSNSDFFSLSYAAGTEAFNLTTIDRLGQFRASTVGAGWRHLLTLRTGVSVSYAYQFRSGGSRQQSYNFGLLRRW